MEKKQQSEGQSMEIEELNDRDLMDVAGGMLGPEVIGDEPHNDNCGCNSQPFNGASGSSNNNCGC